jgi:DHA2 family multidrug resistance protein
MAHHLYGGIDFRTAVTLRVYQAFGLAFLFVPINTIAYVGLAREKYNAASGILNLARNLGGSTGIATLTTLLARRGQIHQHDLAAHTSSFDQAFTSQLAATTQALVRAGATTHEAGRRAVAQLNRELVQQAQTLAYIDTLWLFATLAAVMVPLSFIMRRNDPAAATPAH